jgi:ABC-type multidrug transport system fused ATPase/permease subunit
LSIISLITNPLAKLLSSVPNFVSCIGSFERIDAFADGSQSTLSTEISANGDSSKKAENVFIANVELTEVRSSQSNIIEADNVSFSVKPGENPILKGITIKIRPSILTVVTGKIGSGKSLLLLGLIGELQASGRLKLPTSGIAFCSQATWLINTTIRKNIVGPEDQEIDSEWYEMVIRACALERDLHQLRDGDASIVGSKGLTLSGGQRQRVVRRFFLSV